MKPEDLQRLHQRLDQINTGLGTVAREVGEIKGACEPCRADVREFAAALYGNGSKGIVRRLERVETEGGMRTTWYWEGVRMLLAFVAGVFMVRW